VLNDEQGGLVDVEGREKEFDGSGGVMWHGRAMISKGLSQKRMFSKRERLFFFQVGIWDRN
jgi:hypothetical protein